MKTIAHLTSVHPRYDTRIFIKMCSSLAKVYNTYLVVADGLGDESKNGVNIIDVGAKTGGRLSRMTKTAKKVFQTAKTLNADVYHLHDPELMPIGLRLKKLGKTVIFDMHENLSIQVLCKKWIPISGLRKLISKLVVKVERYYIPHFDNLIVPQPIMKNIYADLNKNVEVVCNFPLLEHVNSYPKRRASKKYLVYVGSVTVERGLFNMLEIMRFLPDDYTLHIAGKISENHKQIIHKKCPDKIICHGVLLREDLFDLYKKVSIGLIMFNNVCQYYMAYSVKLFEYMQNSMFVLMPDFGEWRLFNEKYRVGKNVDTTNARQVAQEILNLDEQTIKAVGQRNFNTIQREFNWDDELQKLYKIYNAY